MSAKRGLGRGFDSLIPTELFDDSFDPTAEQDERISDLRHVDIEEIHADPNQPRRHFDEAGIAELTDSIKEHGILQPIVVVSRKAGGYLIVAGERRYRASKQAGLKKIPVLIRTLSDQHKLELSLIENLQRRDLNILETATAYAKLRDQFNLTLEQIGRRVGGKSVSAVSNTIRLLKLPEQVRDALALGKIAEGQARPLVGVDEAIVNKVLPRIIQGEWSARKIEQFVVNIKKQNTKNNSQSIAPEYALKEKQERWEKRFSTPVAIKTNAKGGGQLVIRFKDEEDFRRLSKLLDV